MNPSPVLAAPSPTPGLTRRRSWPGVIAAPTLPTRPATSWTPSAACSAGRSRPSSCVRTQRPEWTTHLEKSGGSVTAVVPVLPILAETLQAGPCGDLTFIVSADGKPMSKEGFGNQFRKAARAAGVPGSAHGVRKIAATTAANNGATTAQLRALFGWTSDRMPTLYTRTADRERLGREAGHMLENAERTSIPSPGGKVRASEPNC